VIGRTGFITISSLPDPTLSLKDAHRHWTLGVFMYVAMCVQVYSCKSGIMLGGFMHVVLYGVGLYQREVSVERGHRRD
jgi:hypothetical protein